MYQIGVDCHIHSIFSGHAYCTIRDNIMEAAEKGLEGIGIADHFGGQFIACDSETMKDPSQIYTYIGHFFNYSALPEIWHGVRLLRSIEIDIIDKEGHLFGYNLPGLRRDTILMDAVLENMDYAIASVHSIEGAKSITSSQGTELYCNALRNPKVRILGHIGRSRIPFDIDEVLSTAKELGKIIEINEHSFDYSEDIKAVCKKIALRCAELGVWITVNSDAHCSAGIGSYTKAFAMLEELGFPRELIANESLDRFLKVINTTPQ